MDKLSFLGDNTPELTTPAIEQPAETPEPAPSGPVRDEHGRFASKQAAEAPQDAPQAETPVAPTAETPAPEAAPPPAPSGPTLEDRLAKLEEENRGLKTALTQTRQTARQQREAPPPPDVWGDEDHDYFNGERDHWQQQSLNERMYWSRQLADARHGAEVTSKAVDWAAQRCAGDPVFDQQVLHSPDPVGFAVEQYKRDQVLSRIQDPDTWGRLEALLAGNPPAAQTPAPAPIVNPSPPPRSQASTPSAGTAKPGETPAYSGAAFDALFKG